MYVVVLLFVFILVINYTIAALSYCRACHINLKKSQKTCEAVLFCVLSYMPVAKHYIKGAWCIVKCTFYLMTSLCNNTLCSCPLHDADHVHNTFIILLAHFLPNILHPIGIIPNDFTNCEWKLYLWDFNISQLEF